MTALLCRTAVARRPVQASAVERGRDDVACLLLDPRQVLRALEALGVDLVDVLRAGRARGEPAALGDDLEAADRRAVAGRLREPLRDRVARQLRRGDVACRELAQLRLVLRGAGDVDARVRRLAVTGGQLAVALAGRLPGDREDLRGEQAEDEPVLVGGPHGAVRAQERRPRALLAAEGDRGVD